MGLKKNISKIKRMAVGIAVDQKEVLIFTYEIFNLNA